MNKKMLVSVLSAFILLAISASAVGAITPVSMQNNLTSRELPSSNALTKCRIDNYYTIGKNIYGMNIFKYTVEISWCNDGTKAWVTGKTSYPNIYVYGISYKGDNISIVGDKSRNLIVTGSATFTSSVSIPTQYGTFGPFMEAHPWVRIYGYCNNVIAKLSSPF